MMKRFLLTMMAVVLLAGASFALYVTTNYANTQWSGSTTITAGSSTTSDYMLTAGCTEVLLTVSGATPVTSAEAVWYYGSGSTVFTREALTAGTEISVKSTRLKIVLYSTSVQTPEAFGYAYQK